jgi:HAD superfamily hydrolase (TIGR01509 family)
LAVIFDVGNTLWFEAWRPREDGIWRLEAAGARPLVESWGMRLPLPLEDLLRDIWQAYELAFQHERARGTHRDPSLSAFIRAGLAEHGVSISEARAIEWWRASWIHVRHFGVQLYPDALDTLRAVKDAGLLVALNTDRPCTGSMLVPDLSHFGLDRYIDAVVCSGDTGFVKPHPSSFELVLHKLGVPAERAVMVGDSCERDCAGAKALGMTTVLKLNGRYDAPACDSADFAIHDLSELMTLPIFGVTRHPVAAESPTPHEDNNADRY